MKPNLQFVFDLPPAEKLQLVQDLWDDIEAGAGDMPVTDAEIQELDRRRENLHRNPESALDWEEVQRRARAQYGR